MAASRSTAILAGVLVLIYVLLSGAFYWFVDRDILDVLNLIFNLALNFIATCVLLEVFCAIIEIAKARSRKRRVLKSGAVTEELTVQAVVVDNRKEESDLQTPPLGRESLAVESPKMVGKAPTLVNVPIGGSDEDRSSPSPTDDPTNQIRDSCHSTYSVYGYGLSPPIQKFQDPDTDASSTTSNSTILNQEEYHSSSSSDYPHHHKHNHHASIDSTVPLTPIKPEAVMKSETTPTLLRGTQTFTSTSQYPTIDIILVAYLPNEKDIIVSQLRQFATGLSYPRDKLRVICAYNTPKDIPDVEEQLKEVEREFPQNVIVERVRESRSKAQNVNWALKLVRGEIVALFDTDHKLDSMALHYVVDRFGRGDVDLLQGRCAISNPRTSFPTYFISGEFDIIYGLFHPGRALLHGFGLFGGTNGFWKRSLLQHIGMDPTMLTEDIDSAFRSLEAGARIVFDMNVVSYELAPETFGAFWNQRVRWAQGWVQVTLRHVWKSFKTGARSAPFRSRLGLILLLLFREISFYILSQFLIQLLVAIARSWVEDNAPFWETWSKLNLHAASLAGYDLFILLSVGVVACANRSKFVGVFQFVLYVILTPFYLTFQTFLGIYAHGRELAMVDKWVVTSRSTNKNGAPAPMTPTPVSPAPAHQLPLPSEQAQQPEMTVVQKP
ncbi:hypothetical protein HK097_005996 [Rhizophlyctis rosea]|uniref:Glycosyltransferase 2-like domain-containing protein n=1 Tax=Rhizophlyctis rosea TaxID=64517 RepID=A0AAD5SKW7_9FUNG|nr:hypothetical protein HK097_005996 [Rhizophlyctis rosea]